MSVFVHLAVCECRLFISKRRTNSTHLATPQGSPKMQYIVWLLVNIDLKCWTSHGCLVVSAWWLPCSTFPTTSPFSSKIEQLAKCSFFSYHDLESEKSNSIQVCMCNSCTDLTNLRRLSVYYNNNVKVPLFPLGIPNGLFPGALHSLWHPTTQICHPLNLCSFFHQPSVKTSYLVHVECT